MSGGALPLREVCELAVSVVVIGCACCAAYVARHGL